MAGAQIIYFSGFCMDRRWKELTLARRSRFRRSSSSLAKYVAPVYLIVVFVGFCVQNLGIVDSGLCGDYRLPASA
jgi:hypothetical protein